MKLKDRLTLKQVAAELGVSRTTLWRASRSNISDFPKPEVIRRLVYWRKADIPALEAAILRYEGRCVFEENRTRAKRLKQVSKMVSVSAKRPRSGLEKPNDPGQQDLF